MRNWEKYEIECTNYLNDRFKEYARFIHEGGSDSTIPDIKVESYSRNNFFIDVKLSPAQCGQFVLIPDVETHSFEYSEKNATRINTYAKQIVDFMNHDFERFKDSGTNGEDIDMPNGSDIFADWIITTYSGKGVEYFITNEYTILPIDRFKEYFDVTAKYRIKKSGSSSVGKSKIKSVVEYLKTNYNAINTISINDSKIFLKSDEELHNKRFLLDGYEYMFSKRDNEFEIRKLSKTNNANVIFSIKHDEATPGLTESEFIIQLTKKVERDQ
ncbi:MAG: hypothetical protein PHD70_00265 [Anaerostipes sp.]|nr:hypothetical protein [Anaerostipes sp.]